MKNTFILKMYILSLSTISFNLFTAEKVTAEFLAKFNRLDGELVAEQISDTPEGEDIDSYLEKQIALYDGDYRRAIPLYNYLKYSYRDDTYTLDPRSIHMNACLYIDNKTTSRLSNKAQVLKEKHDESFLDKIRTRLLQPVEQELMHYKQAYTNAYEAQRIAHDWAQKYEAMMHDTHRINGTKKARRIFARAAYQSAQYAASKHSIAMQAAERFEKARTQYRIQFEKEGTQYLKQLERGKNIFIASFFLGIIGGSCGAYITLLSLLKTYDNYQICKYNKTF